MIQEIEGTFLSICKFLNLADRIFSKLFILYDSKVFQSNPRSFESLNPYDPTNSFKGETNYKARTGSKGNIILKMRLS